MPERQGTTHQSNGLNRPELPTAAAAWAIFLDVDGTLVDLAETPDQVRVRDGLVDVLRDVRLGLGGALALVSGRPLQEIDDLFTPEAFPAAGVHGAELRFASGDVRHLTIDPASLEPVRRAFHECAARHAGTIVEDKQFAIALHYRRCPGAGAEIRRLGGELADALGVDYHVLEGKMVVEVRVRAAHKGAAVETFLQGAPFVGRRPMYVGDDVTDEDAFETVNALGGVSVVVGGRDPTAAKYGFNDVSEVHRWLRDVAVNLEGDG